MSRIWCRFGGRSGKYVAAFIVYGLPWRHGDTGREFPLRSLSFHDNSALWVLSRSHIATIPARMACTPPVFRISLAAVERTASRRTRHRPKRLERFYSLLQLLATRCEKRRCGGLSILLDAHEDRVTIVVERPEECFSSSIPTASPKRLSSPSARKISAVSRNALTSLSSKSFARMSSSTRFLFSTDLTRLSLAPDSYTKSYR